MKIRSIFIAAFLVGLVFAQAAFAQPSSSDNQKGLTVSPLRHEFNIAPGTSSDGTLTVTNSTDKPMVVDLNAEEFSVINSQYDYAFDPDSNVTQWVTFNPSGVSLNPGESRKITYTVGVPLSAELGGRYISLFASTNVGALDDSASSRQRVASLLYITVLSDVLGAVTRAGHVLSLSSPWLVTDKGTWGVVLQNSGTTHYRSEYSVQVMNLFGGEVASSQGDALVLPGTVRSISDALPLPKILGLYKIVYKIGLGDTPAQTEVRYMLYAPVLPTIAIAAVITVLILELRHRRSVKKR